MKKSASVYIIHQRNRFVKIVNVIITHIHSISFEISRIHTNIGINVYLNGFINNSFIWFQSNHMFRKLICRAYSWSWLLSTKFRSFWFIFETISLQFFTVLKHKNTPTHTNTIFIIQSFGEADISGEELHEILREIDTNMNGQVELDEYLQVGKIKPH